MKWDVEDSLFPNDQSTGSLIMKKAIKYLVNAALAGIGIPCEIKQYLLATPQMRVDLKNLPFSIALPSVIRWQDWKNASLYDYFATKNVIQLWQHQYPQQGATSVVVPELADLVTTTTTENWHCDIRDVEGLSAANAAIEKRISIDEMAEIDCANYIHDLTAECIDRNMAHDQVRILNKNSSDYFTLHGWDARVFLMNAGGAHHFATARYIAGKIGKQYPLHGRLVSHTINRSVAFQLNAKYQMFVSGQEYAYVQFLEAMRMYQAPIGYLALPKPISDSVALCFPRDNARSMRVAALFEKLEFFDLGKHLCMGALIPRPG